MMWKLTLSLALIAAATTASELETAPKTVPACWKDAEGRGAGKLPDRETRKCPNDQEKSAGLCYPKCHLNMEGLGPVCWDECRGKYPSSGLVFCCNSDDTCRELITDLGRKIPEALVKLAVDISMNPAGIVKILRDFRELVADAAQLTLPMCSKVLVEGEEEEAIGGTHKPTHKPTKAKSYDDVEEEIVVQGTHKPTRKPTKAKVQEEEEEEEIGGTHKPTHKPTKAKSYDDVEEEIVVQGTHKPTRKPTKAKVVVEEEEEEIGGTHKPTHKPTKAKSYDDVEEEIVVQGTHKPTHKPTKAKAYDEVEEEEEEIDLTAVMTNANELASKPTAKPTKKKVEKITEIDLVAIAAEAAGTKAPTHRTKRPTQKPTKKTMTVEVEENEEEASAQKA